MDFDGMIQMIGDLLSKEDPEAFSSSWILKRSSPCYRFILKRDIISINLVRLAQCGNELAKRELLSLLSFTIDDWLDRYCFLSRWRGYDAEIRMQVEQCIRRYRYSGSFIRYLFRTLEYAARGIPPFKTHSLDEPVSRSFTAQSYMKGDHRS